MTSGHLQHAIKRAKLWGVLLLCLAAVLGGCRTQEPPLSQEARALKEKFLAELNNLTTQLIQPVSKQNWDAATQILEKSYEHMKKDGGLVPNMIVIMDRNGITRVRVPSELDQRFDFSRYQPAKTAYNKRRKSQAMLYLKGTKIFIVISPLLRNNQVLGAVALTISENELQKKWQVSQEEFLNIDFNR